MVYEWKNTWQKDDQIHAILTIGKIKSYICNKRFATRVQLIDGNDFNGGVIL